MNIKRNITLLAIFLGVVLPVSAEQVWHTSTIKDIYPMANGRFVLRFAADSDHCLNSNTPKYYYVVTGENGVNQQGLELMYSAAMLAAASGKQVSFIFDAATDRCYINRMVVKF